MTRIEATEAVQRAHLRFVLARSAAAGNVRDVYATREVISRRRELAVAYAAYREAWL